METNTKRSRYTVSIPTSDRAMFRSMARRMGWEATVVRTPKEPRYPALDRAIEDVKTGRVQRAKSVEDLIKQLNS